MISMRLTSRCGASSGCGRR